MDVDEDDEKEAEMEPEKEEEEIEKEEEKVKKKRQLPKCFRQTVISSRIDIVEKWQKKKNDTSMGDWCEKERIVLEHCTRGSKITLG